jgi:hypothetical protein
VKTEIEILRQLEDDLRDAAAHERLVGARTARRARRFGWGTVAASLAAILVVAGLLGMVVRGGLGASDDSGGAERAASGLAGSTGAVGATGGAAGGDAGGSVPAAMPTAPGPMEQGSVGVPGSSFAVTAGPAEDLSKIVRTGSIAIRIPDGAFSDGFAAVTRIARTNGGFVLTSTVTRERDGTLTLRIPARRFDQAMLALRELGIVERQRIEGQDVTARYVDLTARLDILQQRRTLLLDLQADATTSSEILRLATLVERTQLEIERIEGNLNVLNDQVAESTIAVRLHEPNPATAAVAVDEANPSLGDAWDDAVHGFLSVLTAVVVGLGYLIPVAVIGLGIWGLTAWVRRRRAAS